MDIIQVIFDVAQAIISICIIIVLLKDRKCK